MLPDLSVVWVIVFVLLLTAVLNRLLYKPLLRVMEERQRAITSARELAERSAAEATRAAATCSAVASERASSDRDAERPP